MRHAFLASLLATAVLGCGTGAPDGGAPEPDSPPVAVAEPAPAGGAPAPDTLAAAWAGNRPEAYAYSLSISCLCIHRGSYDVEVRGGQLSSVRETATGRPVEDARIEWILTVDQLFERIGQAAQLGTPVRVVRHPTLGYPTEAEIGLLADDSGTLYRIENLRAL